MAREIDEGPTEPAGSNPTTRVLIVEDDTGVADIMQAFLLDDGYRVASARNYAEALDQARQQHPDIAVCDWQLEDTRDGIDVARTLQQRYATRIVFVTGQPLDRLRASTQDLDVAEYLRKPLQPQDVSRVLHTIRPPRPPR